MPGVQLSPSLVEQLKTIARPIYRRTNSVLFEAGEPSDGLFLICSGKVKLSLPRNSHIYPPRILGPDRVIGLPAALSGEPYSLTAETAEDCGLLFVPCCELQNLLLHNPAAGYEIVRILGEEILLMRKASKRAASHAEDLDSMSWLNAWFSSAKR